MKSVIPIVAMLFLLTPGCKKKDDVAELRAELEKLKEQNEAAELEKKLAEIKGGTIRGSVFVVTKGGTNFKLGLVGVGLAEAKVAKAYIDAVEESLRASVLSKKASYDRLLSEFKGANSKFEAAAQKYKKADALYAEKHEALEEVAFVFDDTDWRKKYGESNDVFARALVDLIAIDKIRATEGAKVAPLYAKAKAAHDAAREFSYTYDALTHQREVASLVSNIPTDQVTKTDAEGAFSFTVDKGKSYAVIASGQREVGDSVEKYYWLVPVALEANQDTATVMLSNDNLLDDLTSVVGSAAAPPLADLPHLDILTIPTEAKKWTVTDEDGNKRELKIPEVTEIKSPNPPRLRWLIKRSFPVLASRRGGSRS